MFSLYRAEPSYVREASLGGCRLYGAQKGGRIRVRVGAGKLAGANNVGGVWPPGSSRVERPPATKTLPLLPSPPHESLACMEISTVPGVEEVG